MSEVHRPSPGRPLLQIPGPTNLPERVLAAIARPTIDHRSAEFARLTGRLLEGLQKLVGSAGPVVIYPASGSGAWEAALSNALAPGERVLFCVNGHFAAQWRQVAARLGLAAEALEGDWRQPVDPAAVEARLGGDEGRAIKAVAVVHNETSTGVVSDIGAIRRALQGADHSALLMVDTISSLASMDYRHDEWGVDITVAASQKGLMLPPGLGFNVLSQRALAAAGDNPMPRSYWDWTAVLQANERGFFPYTPATNLLFGLDAALDMLAEEGLAGVFARHARLADAVRRAVQAWELDIFCRDPEAHSATLTAVLTPEGHNADQLRRLIQQRFDMALGTGLGPLQGRLFRIGHLGAFDDLMLAGTLCGIDMGLRLAGMPHRSGGVEAALAALVEARL